MSPISTAKFNPRSSTFCLAQEAKFVWIPVLLNNTEVSALRYTHTHLLPTSDGIAKVEVVDVSGRELKAYTKEYQDAVQKTRPPVTPTPDDEEYDEYDDDDDSGDVSQPHSNLQKTQTVVYLRISKPGIINLEQVHDASNVEARISASDSVIVVPCPRVSFVDDDKSKKESNLQCAGQHTERELKISVYGVPPLSLRWWKSVRGKRESFLVEGINGDHKESSQMPSDAIAVRKNLEPQSLVIPLKVPFPIAGTYRYGLEEIVDGVGNVIQAGAEGFGSAAEHSTTRLFHILTKPSVSFQHCSLERPTSLLIGSEAKLELRTTDSDMRDRPLTITLSYQPPADGTSGKLKPWKQVLRTEPGSKDVSFSAGAPGEYTIEEVKGKVCCHRHELRSTSHRHAALSRNGTLSQHMQSCSTPEALCRD